MEVGRESEGQAKKERVILLKVSQKCLPHLGSSLVVRLSTLFAHIFAGALVLSQSVGS